MKIKAAPPFSPTKYGNLHRLPNPTAEPASATSTPNELVNESRPVVLESCDLLALIYQKFIV